MKIRDPNKSFLYLEKSATALSRPSSENMSDAFLVGSLLF